MPPKKNPFDKIREASKQTSRWYNQGSAGSAFAAYSVKNAAFDQKMKGPPVVSEAAESDGKAKPKKRAAAKKSAKKRKDDDEDDFVDDEPVKAPKVKNIFKKGDASADSDGPEKKLKEKDKVADEPVKEGKLKKIAKKNEQAIEGAEHEGEGKEKSARKADGVLKRKAHLAPKPSAIMTPEPSDLNDLFESTGLPEPFSAFQSDVGGTPPAAMPRQVGVDEEQTAKIPTPIQEDDSDQEDIEPLKTAKQRQPTRKPIDKKNSKQPKPASADENAREETAKDDKQRKGSHTSKEEGSRVTSNQRKRSRVSSMIDQDASDGDDESSEPKRARVLHTNQEDGQILAHRKVSQTKAGACDDEEQQGKDVAEPIEPTQAHATDDEDETRIQRRRTRAKRVIDDDEDEDEDGEITAPFWQPYGGSSNVDHAPSCFLGLGRIPERKIEFFSEAIRDLVKEYGTDREISTDERGFFEDGEEVRDVSVRIDTADSAKIIKRDIDGKVVLGKRLQIKFAEA